MSIDTNGPPGPYRTTMVPAPKRATRPCADKLRRIANLAHVSLSTAYRFYRAGHAVRPAIRVAIEAAAKRVRA